MNESFIAYVDESGDEGFNFKPNGQGSSEWFVLSSLVVRKINDPAVRDAVAAVRHLLGRPKDFALHFRNLKHEQRIPYVQAIARTPVRIITVMIHKPSLKDPETFRDRRLYHYSVRLLLERVSWLCRDEHRRGEGDGSAKVIFSNRSSTHYDELRDYVAKLINDGNPLEVRIEGSVIKPEQIQARVHQQYAGLQAVDAVASSFYYAATPTQYGPFTEPRYTKILGPRVYKNNGKAIGHGLKFWPREADDLAATSELMGWVAECFPKK